jgi:uncharacterized protein
VRVLSIDGGGIRGLIPALVLADVERRTGRPVSALFDLVAGTSTGAILACALARPGDDGRPRYRAEDLIALYESEGPQIFDRSLLERITSVEGVLDEKYPAGGLERALDGYFGRTRLSEALVPLLLTAYEIEGRFAFFFRSERARTDPTYDFTLAEAAHASSAAPTYFEPVRVTDAAGDRTYALIDGGVFATAPAGCALAELGEDAPDRLTVLASLGTGEATRPIPYEQARDWGQLGWARPVIDVLLSGQPEVTDFQLSRLLGDRYVRLQTRLDTASDDLDDASPDNLRALRAEGERLVRERAADIDALCARLVA